ncbi:MAG: hypothetical protein JO019_01515 [Candidatus Kaiserbacteria bacterium]|nr:hypothetical protein [Candidatus Kaiserbacteria bacterium]
MTQRIITWLKVFTEERDRGVVSPAESVLERERRGGTAFDYRELYDRRLSEEWTAGYVQAALLRAANDRKALLVRIPGRMRAVNDVAAHLASVRQAFSLIAYEPWSWSLTYKPGIVTLVVPLFSRYEMGAALALKARTRTRSA